MKKAFTHARRVLIGGIFIARALLVLCAALLMCVSAGCGPKTALTGSISDYPDERISVDVTLEVKEQSVATDAERLTLVHRNSSEDMEYVFGSMPESFDMLRDGKWYEVKPKEDAAWDALGYHLSAGGELEDAFWLERCYGTLEPGRYRIVKSFSPMKEGAPERPYAIAEFDVR